MARSWPGHDVLLYQSGLLCRPSVTPQQPSRRPTIRSCRSTCAFPPTAIPSRRASASTSSPSPQHTPGTSTLLRLCTVNPDHPSRIYVTLVHPFPLKLSVTLPRPCPCLSPCTNSSLCAHHAAMAVKPCATLFESALVLIVRPSICYEVGHMLNMRMGSPFSWTKASSTRCCMLAAASASVSGNTGASMPEPGRRQAHIAVPDRVADAPTLRLVEVLRLAHARR